MFTYNLKLYIQFINICLYYAQNALVERVWILVLGLDNKSLSEKVGNS